MDASHARRLLCSRACMCVVVLGWCATRPRRMVSCANGALSLQLPWHARACVDRSIDAIDRCDQGIHCPISASRLKLTSNRHPCNKRRGCTCTRTTSIERVVEVKKASRWAPVPCLILHRRDRIELDLDRALFDCSLPTLFLGVQLLPVAPSVRSRSSSLTRYTPEQNTITEAKPKTRYHASNVDRDRSIDRLVPNNAVVSFMCADTERPGQCLPISKHCYYLHYAIISSPRINTDPPYQPPSTTPHQTHTQHHHDEPRTS